MTLARFGVNFDGTIPDGQPFSKTWKPVSYRAAYTYEPIPGLMFYSMYATAYDPAGAAIFSVTPATLQLTSTRLYEPGPSKRCGTAGRSGPSPPTTSRSVTSSSR